MIILVALRGEMNKEDIQFFLRLDENKLDGTLQTLLMSNNLSGISFKEFSKTLIKRWYNEKRHLIKDNIKLSNLVGEVKNGGE